ncbi:uncharacterized protein LOC125837500 [Solanum verrucosum]|uniref:uncharacterized protein LOC125837500 n=1 Tax=Solanum verrucosum TaxID=315347 RepID=UPI0020D0BE5E|nr:uncharacterized protein LOC125837500 [Solanum verrucosum]
MKDVHHHSVGLLQRLPIPDLVFEDIAMDFITCLQSSKGKSTLMTVVDCLTKYGHFIPLPSTFSTKIVAETFVVGVIRLHGPTRTIVTDRDPRFLHPFWEEINYLHGTSLGMKCHTIGFPCCHEPNIGTIHRSKLRQVFVKLKPYRQNTARLQQHHKLGRCYFGPFQVLKRLGEVAYKLELPAMARIHPAFHVSILKRCLGEPEQQITLLSIIDLTEHGVKSSQNLKDKVLSQEGSIVIEYNDDVEDNKAKSEDNFIQARGSNCVKIPSKIFVDFV